MKAKIYYNFAFGKFVAEIENEGEFKGAVGYGDTPEMAVEWLRFVITKAESEKPKV